MTPRQKRIEKVRQELRQLEAEEEYATRHPAQDVADALHSALCHHNHTDRCGWEYSSWERPCATRQAYLQRAEKILQITGHYDRAMAVVQALTE